MGVGIIWQFWYVSFIPQSTAEYLGMEHTICPNCHTLLGDPYLISCPKCRTILRTHEQNQQIEQNILTQQKEALARELEQRVLKRLLKWIGVGFALLGAIAGIGLWQIYTNLRTIVTDRIAAQFDEPQIRTTLTEVAQKEASVIIKDSVQASIDQVKQSADKAVKSSEEFLQQTKERLETLGKDLEEKEILRGWVAIIPNGDRIISGWEGGMRAHQSAGIPYVREIFNVDPAQPGKWVWTWNCNDKNIARLIILTEKYPYIPYTYVALADCLKQLGNRSWRAEIEKSKNILEKMTQIHPHPIEVDRFYDFVNRLLENNKLGG